MNAKPTAAVGNRTRTASVFIAVRPRLFGQRLDADTDLLRRGAISSHTAIPAKTAAKAPRRIRGS